MNATSVTVDSTIAPHTGVLADAFARWRKSSYRYVVECVGDKPWPHQAEVLHEIDRKIAVGEKRILLILLTCPGWGKDRLAAWLFKWVMDCWPNARGLTLAQRYESVDRLVWPEIRDVHQKSATGRLGFGVVLEGKPLFKVQGQARWFGMGTSAEHTKAESLRGHHSETAAFRFIDEASTVPREFRIMTHGLSDAPFFVDMVASNAFGAVGWFFEMCKEPPPGAIFRRHSIDDLVANGTFEAEYRDSVEQEFKGRENPEYRALYLCEFLKTTALSPLDSAALADCFAKEPTEAGPVAVAVDVGRSTDGDPSVISGARNFDLIEQTEFQIRDTEAIADQAINAANRLGAVTIIVDSIGVGAGVADKIRRRWRGNVVEFIANEKASNPVRFADRATEVAWDLVERINARNCALVHSEKLERELGQIEFEPITPVDGGKFGGRWKLHKAPNGEKSPNHFDSLVMATAAPKVAAEDAYRERIKILGRKCPECRKAMKPSQGYSKRTERDGRVTYIHAECVEQKAQAA